MLACILFYSMFVYVILDIIAVVPYAFLISQYVTRVHLFSGVLGETQADPLAELQRASADQSPTQRREGTLESESACNVFLSHSVILSSCSGWCMCLFQYDSDGSDSQESSEEAELRRKKIEALKVSLQGAQNTYLFLYDSPLFVVTSNCRSYE